MPTSMCRLGHMLSKIETSLKKSQTICICVVWLIPMIIEIADYHAIISTIRNELDDT